MSSKLMVCLTIFCTYFAGLYTDNVHIQEGSIRTRGFPVDASHGAKLNSVVILEKETKFNTKTWTQERKTKAPRGTGCSCIKYDCGCCAHLDIPKVKINDTGCVNITYLPNDYGISVTFSLDNKVYINETISARNPPPLCFGIPHFKVASLCLRFSDLSVTHHKFYGCVSVEAHLYHMKVESIKLGCFTIPPGNERRGFLGKGMKN